MSQHNKGWIKILAVGCLIVFLLIGTASFYVYKRIKENGPKMVANLIEMTSEGMLKELQIPQEESIKAMQVIKEFTIKIRNGQISFQQGKSVAEALGKQSVMGAITMRSLEMTYISPSSMSYEEKDQSRKTLTRVAYGLSENMISQETVNSVLDTISEEVTDDYGNKFERWKPFLTTEELKEMLSKFSSLADQAGVEDKEFPYDISETIRKAIEKGLQQAQ